MKHRRRTRRLVLPYLKAYAALLGSLATGLLTLYTDNETLTVLAIVGTTVATWSVPNIDPEGEHQDESVQPPARVARADLDEPDALL